MLLFYPADPEEYETRPTPARGHPIGLTLNLLALFARLSQVGMLNMASEGIQTMRRPEDQCDDRQFTDCDVSLAAL